MLGGWRREAELRLGGEEEVCIVFIKMKNLETRKKKKKAKHKCKHEESKIENQKLIAGKTVPL